MNEMRHSQKHADSNLDLLLLHVARAGQDVQCNVPLTTVMGWTQWLQHYALLA